MEYQKPPGSSLFLTTNTFLQQMFYSTSFCNLVLHLPVLLVSPIMLVLDSIATTNMTTQPLAIYTSQKSRLILIDTSIKNDILTFKIDIVGVNISLLNTSAPLTIWFIKDGRIIYVKLQFAVRRCQYSRIITKSQQARY